jgi:hypothetical protein
VMKHDRDRIAAFYDEYGEREWTRFEDGRTPAPSLDVHLDHVRTFIQRATECSTSARAQADL